MRGFDTDSMMVIARSASVPAFVVAAFSLAACGGASSAGSSQAAPTTVRHVTPVRRYGLDRDYDNDNPTPNTLYDVDDGWLVHYGHAGTAAELRQVTATIGSYYRAAARDDGRAACALLFSLIAETVPETYADTRGVRSRSCPGVLHNLFAQERSLYRRESATVRVTSLRTEGQGGWALLGFVGRPDRRIHVRREDGRWTVAEVVDIPLP